MRGAIFDVDGTLLDSMQVWWDVVVDFFKEHGVELPYEEAKEYKEMTMKESIPTIKTDLILTCRLKNFQILYAHGIKAIRNNRTAKKRCRQIFKEIAQQRN